MQQEKTLIINEILKKDYVIRHEYIDQSDYGCDDPLLMKKAYSHDGDYIGDSKWAYRLVERYGITQFEKKSDDHCVVSIGYSPKKRKWFGWSHRAIFGFGIGSKVKQGDCGFLPKNKTEFKAAMLRWHTSEHHAKTKAHACASGKGVYVSWQYNDTVPNKSLRGTTATVLEEYPKKWGKGKWTAKTMEDAKKMAIDFSEGVS